MCGAFLNFYAPFLGTIEEDFSTISPIRFSIAFLVHVCCS